ncbi:MAG: hypothetical protein AMJ45_00905 [Syntrophobacter sp. DG_60]|nr:MAG: hypothetical protein AMJ45_00905 [Syntrophobacter sp. DG_60]
MNTDRFKYKESTDIILRSFYEVYNELGDGFIESVHENVLYILTEYGNFGRKPEFKRFVYDNKRKNISGNQRKSVAEELRIF